MLTFLPALAVYSIYFIFIGLSMWIQRQDPHQE